jgi:hypothetical protein
MFCGLTFSPAKLAYNLRKPASAQLLRGSDLLPAAELLSFLTQTRRP